MALKIIRRGQTYHAHGTIAGRRIRQSLGTGDRTTAQEEAAALETRIRQSRLYGTAAVITFEEAALAYMQDGGSPRFLAPLLVHFKGQTLGTITPKAIRDAARALYPSAAGSTRNRQGIAPARAVINHAAQEGLCQPIRVRQFPTTRPQKTAVGPYWVAAFRAHASNRYLAALARFIFETGCRISEALDLTPDAIDLVHCTADLGITKNGDTYTADFSTDLRVELANLKPRRGRVFGYTNRHSIYGPWATTCKRAGIAYVPPHQSGRHSFATALDQAGWTASQIADAGRWKSTRIVQDSYVHPENAGRAAASLIGTILTQEESGDTVKALKKRGK